jgi:putative glycosyltransferase (TIGR04372 family)
MIILDKILYFLNDKLKTMVQLPPMAAGNRCEEIYYGLLKARRQNKKVVFSKVHYVFPAFLRTRITNSAVLKISSPYVSKNILFVLFWDVIFTSIYLPGRIVALMLQKFLKFKINHRWFSPFFGRELLWSNSREIEFDWDKVNDQKWNRQFHEYLPIDLTPPFYKKAHKIRLQMGIPEDAWFMCVHVREGGFHNDWETGAYRNCDISNYYKAFKFVTDMGGWVVRLGDNTMTPLPKMEKVIDYANSSFKSELLDVYLVNKCKVYCGIASGIYDMAVLFQKPMICPNIFDWLFNTPVKPGDLGIMKHMYSVEKKRFLSVKEILNETSARDISWGFCDKSKYLLYENSNDEILDLFVEFFKKQDSLDESKLQKDFKTLRMSQGRKNVEDQKKFSRKENSQILVEHQYRFAANLVRNYSQIANLYLEKNWNHSSRSTSEFLSLDET